MNDPLKMAMVCPLHMEGLPLTVNVRWQRLFGNVDFEAELACMGEREFILRDGR
jgi:hypothetical protein